MCIHVAHKNNISIPKSKGIRYLGQLWFRSEMIAYDCEPEVVARLRLYDGHTHLNNKNTLKHGINMRVHRMKKLIWIICSHCLPDLPSFSQLPETSASASFNCALAAKSSSASLQQRLRRTEHKVEANIKQTHWSARVFVVFDMFVSCKSTFSSCFQVSKPALLKSRLESSKSKAAARD